MVQTDTLARYHRQRGDDSRFLTGTDDNALKNVQAAEVEGLSVQELVDRNAEYFRGLRGPLDLSFDDFIRTSSERRHTEGAQKLWRLCVEAGDVYQKSYEGLYCVGCEQYYTEGELVNGLCPEHGVRPELVEEENYFFRLSRYAGELERLIESGEMRILPETRLNEVLSFVRRGLEDFSISRSQARARGWGVPVPDDSGQVMYVWFDALANYITALDYVTEGELYQRYWVENPNRVHVIGKGILRFHAVYWPAMLLSAGLPTPTAVCVHEYLTVEGRKISKSLGNVIDPTAMVDRFGTEALRYWLLRDMPRTEDADFTFDRLAIRYNTDLANDLGNLLNRTVSMIVRYRQGVVPQPGEATDAEREFERIAAAIPAGVESALDDFDFRAALASIWELVLRANRYVEESAPWTLSKAERGGDEAAGDRLDTTLYTLAEALRLLSYHLAPFLPSTSERIAAQLGIAAEAGAPSEAAAWGGLTPGVRVAAPQPIFPRIEVASSV